MDSVENMAKLVLLLFVVSTYAADIVYLWRLFQSPEFEIFEGLES